MRPLPFIAPYAWIFWVVYVWAFWPEMFLVRRAQLNVAKGGSKDSGSLRVILFGMWIALLLAFPLSLWRAAQMPARVALVVFCCGVALLIAGSLLRRYCWRVLGQFFTGDVQARSDQPVIDRGPYRWVRHPSYTGGILMFGGIGLALGSWAAFAILLLVSIAVYRYRVAIEERELVQTLGDPYRAYMQRTKRFIPFVI